MSCLTTTGLTGNGQMDSDSVNLGSNPSPPATEILEKSGDLGAGHPGPERHDAPDGRTRVGTPLRLTPDERAKLRALAKHPTYGPFAQRVLTQFRNLAITPSDPDLLRAIRASVAELADMKGA